jgi:hypothetical protein
MDTIDRATFTALAGHHRTPSISLYLPTHRTGTEKDQDRIRLKNLIRSACDSLIADGMRAPAAEALLLRASALLDDAGFWRETSDGLAIFVDAEDTLVFRVDTTLPEQYVVGSRFYLRPLALAYHGDESFFALALDRNRARLFAGDRAGIHELPLDAEVSSFAEATKYDGREESLQFTTHASPESVNSAGSAIGQFHGHGGENVDKNELERFVAGLEKAVTAQIGAENTSPLLLLGVEYQLDAYRSVNSYRALAPQQIEGATDELTDRAIHVAALQALAPRFAAVVGADLAELSQKASALVSTDPAEIVSAAASGRVKTLFFDEAAGPYGVFDRELFAVSAICSAAPRYLRDTEDTELAAGACGWDLVDLALAETVLHGGAAHAFDGEMAPVAGVAAVLRY